VTYFIIIRGPLGSGKTTVSLALSKVIGAEVVSIDLILDRLEDDGSIRPYLEANKAAARMALKSLARGTPVVLDESFCWKRQIEDLVTRLPYPHEVFTLKAPLTVCIERDAHRTRVYGAEAARQVHHKIARFDCGIPLDATRNISLIVEEICSHLPPDRVDASAASQGRHGRSPHRVGHR
jgi:predicted kinase